jgi:hypothetical protein
MKLTDVIKVWDILHVKDTGELGYSDLENAIDATCGVENDVFINMEIKGKERVVCPFCLSDITEYYKETDLVADKNKMHCPDCDGLLLVEDIRSPIIYEVTPVFEEKK